MKINKITGLITVVVLTIAFTSCKEEIIGQYPVDGVAPAQVSVVSVANFKGGATITYTMPHDPDFLYVKAICRLPNGKERKVLSSSDNLTIKGFSKSSKTEVSLISVDGSRNESAPVKVEIEPLNSPIFEIFNTLEIKESFGGFKLSWENTDREDIVVGVLLKNDENRYELLDNFYSTVVNGTCAIRNMNAIPTDFGIYIRDIYDNSTDTLFTTITPWREIVLDKQLWRPVSLCSTFSLSQYSSAMNVLWDNRTIAGLDAIYYLNRSVNTPIFFTVDLGVSAKLSRFAFWGREQWYFNLHHPKEFEIWGTNDPETANNACGWDGWTLLLSGVSSKPSGNEPLADTELTAEDRQLAAMGEEFEFPLEIPLTRFIRFKCLRTWTDSENMFLGELSFWGDPVE
jgi:hypothetical protein